MARPRTQDIVPAVAGGWVVTVAWQLSQASVTSTARYRCSALLCSAVLYSGDNGAPWASVCTPHCTDWLEKSAGRITTLASSQETWCSVAVCCVSTSNNTADCTYRHSPVPATGRGRGCGGRCTPPPPPPPPRPPRSPWSPGSG